MLNISVTAFNGFDLHIAAPDFTSSFAHGDYVYFTFRETAVEYMNCGKVSHHSALICILEIICIMWFIQSFRIDWFFPKWLSQYWSRMDGSLGFGFHPLPPPAPHRIIRELTFINPINSHRTSSWRITRSSDSYCHY